MNTDGYRLTSRCQVNFSRVCVFLEGGKQLCFRTQHCSVSIGKPRLMTTQVSILADLSFTEAAGGATHIEPCQANEPAKL